MPSKNFPSQLLAAVAAGEPLLRIESDDPDTAFRLVETTCEARQWLYASWDAAQGLTDPSGALTYNNSNDTAANPASMKLGPALVALHRALKSRDDCRTVGDKPPPSIILAVRNYGIAVAAQPEPLIAMTELIAQLGERCGGHILIVTPPKAKLPEPLDKAFHTITQALPDVDELEKLIPERFDVPDTTVVREAAKAVLGLSRRQAVGAIGESIARGKAYDPAFLWDRKAQAINTDGLVQILPQDEKLDDMGGNEGAKTLLRELLKHKSDDPDLRAKGALCMGPAGTGKTMLAKAIGAATGMQTVLLNPGALMGEYVGTTERNTRKVFELLDALAPCVVVIDEVGKVMPKYGGSGDSGVSNRMLGSFLSYMNDTKAGVFWMFTSNEDVFDLHEAFTRAERVDLKFYVGLPTAPSRAAIWKIYVDRYFRGRLPDFDTSKEPAVAAMRYMASDRSRLSGDLLDFVVDDEGWTGAEIKACCRLAAITGRTLAETSQLICPVARVGADNITRMQAYAENIGALDAETGTLYKRETTGRANRKDGTPRSTRRSVGAI